MKRISIALYTLIIVNVWTSLSSCSVSDDTSKMNPARSIEFGVMVSETKAVKSRALDSVYVNSEAYQCNFYIESTGTNNGQSFYEFGTYIVSPSIEGLLENKVHHEPLQWNGFTSDHTFYGWTLPWCGDNYEPSRDSVMVTFDNSNGLSGYEQNKNNERYETFVGSLVTGRSFDKTGKYVEMIFKHLVSKIKIDRFSLIEEDGSVQANLQANITFYGMPSEATFYPHPDHGGWPEVKGKQPALDSGDKGVTYYIANGSNPDYAYICPELDFSKMYFSVELVNEKYGKEGDYIGNFDNVKFIREEGIDFDKGGDDKILHAGEMMTLNIVLYPGVGPGISILIQNWSTGELNETVHHVHPGIYTADELFYLFDVFKRYRESSDPDAYAELKRLAELYGIVEENGEFDFVFPLYGDIDFNNNYLYITRGCMVDGQGHTIIMKTNTVRDIFSGKPYYNISSVRNVYLMDANGNNRLYIDNDGVIWTYNEEKGQYIETENKLPPLNKENGKYSYNICIETGEIDLAEYPWGAH